MNERNVTKNFIDFLNKEYGRFGIYAMRLPDTPTGLMNHSKPCDFFVYNTRGDLGIRYMPIEVKVDKVVSYEKGEDLLRKIRNGYKSILKFSQVEGVRNFSYKCNSLYYMLYVFKKDGIRDYRYSLINCVWCKGSIDFSMVEHSLRKNEMANYLYKLV